MKLPCHNRLIQVFPDAMHTIKDAVEHVFNIITGAEDSVKVRNAEAAVNQFGVSRTGDTATGTLSTTGCKKQKKKKKKEQQPCTSTISAILNRYKMCRKQSLFSYFTFS